MRTTTHLWLTRAEQTLSDARLLHDNGPGTASSSCNRSYIAMHQAMVAALFESDSTRDALSMLSPENRIAAFCNEFVRGGDFSKPLYRGFVDAQARSNSADFHDRLTTWADATASLKTAEEFIEEVKLTLLPTTSLALR